MNIELYDTEAQAIEAAEGAAGKAGLVLLEAERMQVVDNDSYLAACTFLKEVKTTAKAIEVERRSFTDPLNAVIKKFLDRFRPASDGLEAAEAVLKKKITAYSAELERVRREAEAKAAEDRRREEERLRKLSEKAAARGDVGKALVFEAKAEEASLAVGPVLPAAPEVDGLAFVTTWGAEVTDLKKLAAAVLAGTVPELAIQADMKYLGAVARSTRGAMQWPGVKWISRQSARQKV